MTDEVNLSPTAGATHDTLSQFIVYACPVGPLAEQLDYYLQASLKQCGANAAHRYMPHCTLTGFFHEVESSIPRYVQALEQSLTRAQQTRLHQPIVIRALSFNDDWHGLEIEADWLKTLVDDFSKHADSSTRPDEIRLKSWLHLSLAYKFDLSHAAQLRDLAEAHVNIESDVNWELRYYQRLKELNTDTTAVSQTEKPIETYGGDRWICHHAWKL